MASAPPPNSDTIVVTGQRGADSTVMMALGDYRFSLNTAAYQELCRTNSWRWPTVDRIGARPASQFVGPGEESISMSGCIYPHFKGGLGQLDAMRAQADKGEASMLVDGMGKQWGKFVITEVRETQTTFFSNGAPRKVDFDITLQAYGDDAEAASAGVGLAGVTIPALAVPSLESTIADLPSLDPAAGAKLVASKSLMSMSGVRSLMGMTSAGVDGLSGAISTVATVLGSVEGAVSGLQRASAAVPNALNALVSSPGLSTFAAFGTDLNTVIAAANNAGTLPLDSVLDRINIIGPANIIPRLVTDADQAAALTALAGVRANG